MDFQGIHDCRITHRCLRHDLRLRLPVTATFASLAPENTFVDVFFERLQNSPDGHAENEASIPELGEGRDVFLLRYGGRLGLTWLDLRYPPATIVWLLAVMEVDEVRGERGALADLGERERDGVLYPDEFDYARFKLERRKLHTSQFGEMARRDARQAMHTTGADGPVQHEIAGISVLILWKRINDYLGLYVAVSNEMAKVDGNETPLTNDRFMLVAEAVRQAARSLFGPELLAEEPTQYPSELNQLADPRVFVFLFGAPRVPGFK